MDVVATVASLVLGVAFLVAGGSKLAAGDAWREQAGDLGAPGWIAPVVPWVEIVTGAALVAQLARPWPAIAALTLLATFTALLGANLARGRRPACACFGAWSSRPIGAGHLARNGLLSILALLALAA